MLKRYCAKCSKFNIHLVLEDGTSTVLVFEGKDAITKERFADVSDVAIQKALEATSSFGLYFYKSNEFDWMKEEEVSEVEETEEVSETEVPEEEEPEKEVLMFKTGAEAKTWLSQKNGVQSYKLTNKAKMIEEAALLGYAIEFETK